MRIARFVIEDDPVYGVLEGTEEQLQDETATVTQIVGDPFFQGIQKTNKEHKLADVRLVAPVIPRSKVVAVGKNYQDHAKELDSMIDIAQSDDPLMFLKPNTAVIGPNEPVTIPSFSEEISYEAELAVVIKRICKDVPLDSVDDVIFGYTCANDLTARDIQRKDPQWARAKGWDGSCPLGPWIETDFNPEDAQITGTLYTSTDDKEGQIKQQDSTSNMIFGVREIVSFVSSSFTLLPGDVILTGTSQGIGTFRAGERYSVNIDGIGTLSNPLREAA